MKKCIVALIVVLTIVACKPNNTEKVAATCINLDDYYALNDVYKRAEWLRNNGDDVCDSILEEAIIRDHKVTTTITDRQEAYTTKWETLRAMIGTHNYDAYLSVEVTGTKVDSLKMVNKYEDGHYCFSMALIRTMAKLYAKDGNAEFKFSIAKIAGQTVVVIQVDGNDFYDYSTDPKAVHTPNIPL